MPNLLTRLLESPDNLVEGIAKISELLGVKISRSSLKRDVLEHPDHPTLFCISDILTRYGIENAAIQIAPDKLSEVPTPFITILTGKKKTDNYFTVVKEVKDQQVLFFDDQRSKWNKMPLEEFGKAWNRIVLMCETTDNAGEADYENVIKQEGKKKSRLIAAISCLPVLLFAAIAYSGFKETTYPVIPFSFALLTVFGMFVCAMLLLYEFGQYSPFLQQLCTSRENTDCSAVLKSKGSNIGGVSWTLIGSSYFSGLALFLLFSGTEQPSNFFLLACTSLLAVLYLPYSLFYQWRVVKQWCPLCLLIQLTLLIQFLVAISAGWFNATLLHEISVACVIRLAASFLISYVLIASLFFTFKESKRNKSENADLKKIAYNSELFWAILKDQKQLTEVPTGLGITFGNPHAKYTVIKLCNPYCGPCSKAHKPFEDLINSSSILKGQIIFSVSKMETEPRIETVRHFLNAAANRSEKEVKKMLDEWYGLEVKDYDFLVNKYPATGSLERHDTMVRAMREWSEGQRINFTPTFFVSSRSVENGDVHFYQLPKIYKVTDLAYFLTND
jgi:uncharacterized membrane protein